MDYEANSKKLTLLFLKNNLDKIYFRINGIHPNQIGIETMVFTKKLYFVCGVSSCFQQVSLFPWDNFSKRLNFF